MEALKGVRKVKIDGIPRTVRRVVYTDGSRYYIRQYTDYIEVVYSGNKWRSKRQEGSR